MVDWRNVSNKLKAALSFLYRRILRPVCNLAYFFLIVFLILWAFTVITLVATHICLIFGKGPLDVCRWWPDMILSFVFGSGAATLTEAKYASLVSDMIAAFAFLMAALAVVQVQLYKRRVRRELQEAQRDYEDKVEVAKQEFEKKIGIISYPIKQEGEDDLVWMLPHYRGGDRVTVFAGGFGWISINPEMKKRVIELAKENKLNLISYRTREQVKEDFDRKNSCKLFEQLEGCFRYESGLGNSNKVVCTMIQRSPTDWEFLYKSRADQSGHAFNAQVLSDTGSLRELLHILSRLTKADHWGMPASDSSSAKQS